MKDTMYRMGGGGKTVLRKYISLLIILFCTFAVFAQSVYEVDLSKMPAVNDDKTATFDKATNIFTITHNPKLQGGGVKGIYLWLNKLDISSYNILKVNYKSLDDCGFRLELDYNSSEKESIYCPSNLKEVTIPLKNNQKTLNGFFIQGYLYFGRVVIDSITLEKVSNPQKTDLYANNEPPVIDKAASGTIDNQISAWDFVKKLGVGYQYSPFLAYNSAQEMGMDYYSAWGYKKPTKEEIHFIKEKGFKLLRLHTSPQVHLLEKSIRLIHFL